MKTKKFDNHDKLLVLWCLSKRNDAEEAYRKAIRHYCLGINDNWDEVQKCRQEALRNGITDERLLEIDIEVANSITDEEIIKAVEG